MDSEIARALIASILYNGDATLYPASTSWNQELYLQHAQYLLESSYKNYQHPASDIAKLSVDEMVKKLSDLGYTITSPVDASKPRQPEAGVWPQPLF